jgi:hypothetical protein
MKQSVIWVLVAANIALAATLTVRGVRSNSASAQTPARAAEPGKYVLIPAESQLGVGLVFVLDTSNRRLGAIAPDNQDKMAGMATVALDPVFDAFENRSAPAPAGTNRRGNNPR